MDRYLINVARNGQHYANIQVPAGTTLDDARQMARVFSTVMPSDGLVGRFEVSLSAWTEIGKDIDIWGGDL